MMIRFSDYIADELPVNTINRVYFLTLILFLLLLFLLLSLFLDIPARYSISLPRTLFYLLEIFLLIGYVYLVTLIRFFPISIETVLTKEGEKDKIWNEFEESIKKFLLDKGYQIERWDNKERIILINKGIRYDQGSIKFNLKDMKTIYRILKLDIPNFLNEEIISNNEIIGYESWELSEKNNLVSIMVKGYVKKKSTFSQVFAVSKSCQQQERYYEKHGFKIDRSNVKIILKGQ